MNGLINVPFNIILSVFLMKEELLSINVNSLCRFKFCLILSISVAAMTEFPLKEINTEVHKSPFRLIINQVGDSGQNNKVTMVIHGKHNKIQIDVLQLRKVLKPNVITNPVL